MVFPITPLRRRSVIVGRYFSSWSVSVPSNRSSQQSDVAAFDLFGQRLDQFRHLLQVRIDVERLAEGIERALVVAEILHDHAEACERAEMPGLADQHLLDVGERASVV